MSKYWHLTHRSVQVELLEHPGGLAGSEVGHAGVVALDKFVSNYSNSHEG